MENFEKSNEDNFEEKKDYLNIRSLERHKGAKKDLDSNIEDINRELDKLLEDSETEKEGLNDEELEKSIQEMIDKIGGSEKKQELEHEGFSTLKEYAKERKGRLKKIEKLSQLYYTLMKRGLEIPRLTEKRGFWAKAETIKKNIEEKEEELNKLSQESPEAFLADGLYTLRDYKKQFEDSGIVETPYVKEKQDKIEEKLVEQRVVALVGETGTGKTRIAEKLAEKITGKETEWVFGHGNISKEDLLYHLGIKPEKFDPKEFPEKEKELENNYREMHPDIPEEKMQEALEKIKDIALGQAQEKEMQTEVVLGPILRAAEEGKVVIIDEFNYIQPKLLASLNSLMEAEPGKNIEFMGRDIKIKEGFGIIFTGNISINESKRYLERESLDPAFVNRLNSGFIEYNTPPQEIKRNFTESISEEGEEKEDIDNDLFRIGLTHLVDEKGNLDAPKDALDVTWRLARCFSILQKIYAGENLTEGEDAYFDSSRMGTGFSLLQYHASMRTFGEILESWKQNNYETSIDYHIYDNLIRPAESLVPEEAAQMLYILSSDYGNFFSENHSVWGKMKADHRPEWQIKGGKRVFEKASREEFNENPDIYYFTPQETIEALKGERMPTEEKTTKEYRLGKEQVEKVEEIAEQEKEVQEIESLLEGIRETAEFFCEDESKIME